MYGKYTEKLLVAVTYDADNQVFPLWFACADSESTENWTWFLEYMRQYVTMDNRQVCVLFDHHGGIKRFVVTIFPEPWGLHRYCACHLASKLNKN